MSGFNYEKDANGVVTVTMDMEGPVNSMSEAFLPALRDTVEKLEAARAAETYDIDATIRVIHGIDRALEEQDDLEVRPDTCAQINHESGARVDGVRSAASVDLCTATRHSIPR